MVAPTRLASHPSAPVLYSARLTTLSPRRGEMETRRVLIILGTLMASALIATALLWPRTAPASAGIPTLLGDVNCNGVVSIEDAQLIAQLVVGRISELSCVGNPPVPSRTPAPASTPTPSPTLQPQEARALALAWLNADDVPFPYSTFGFNCSTATWEGTRWMVPCNGTPFCPGCSIPLSVTMCVYEQTLLAAPC